MRTQGSRRARHKSNKEFWKDCLSLDNRPDLGESPYLSDVVQARMEGVSSYSENMYEMLDRADDKDAETRSIVAFATKLFEKISTVASEARKCLPSLRDFLLSGGEKEETICRIAKRIKNRENYQRTKERSESHPSGAAPVTPGGVTATCC